MKNDLSRPITRRILARRSTWLFGGGLFVLVLAGGWSLKPVPAVSELPATMPSMARSGPGVPPQSSNTEKNLSVVGTIEAGEVISVAAPFDATLKERLFSFDTMVAEGQALLRLDTGELQGRLNEAKVAMLKAENTKQDFDTWEKSSEMARASRNALLAQQQVEQSERKIQEVEGLLKQGIIPRSEHDGLVEQLNSHRAQLAAANDDLKAVRDKASRNNREIARIEYEVAAKKYRELLAALTQERIAAPRTGIIAKTAAASGQSPSSLEAGSRVTRGQTLFTIADVNRLRIAAKVDEADVLGLRPGLRAEITMDAQAMPPIVGQVIEVSAQGTQNNSGARSASFDILIELPELDAEQRKRLRVGMSCNVTILKVGWPQ